MFSKVLIANRGEIALRINRACQELGVRTVAIYSEADRDSLHVRQADEAFCVGPGPVARSYLNIPNIISTALVTGCDAIHPGYGFLAENARFAEICADHGLDLHRAEARGDRGDGRQGDGEARHARSRRRDDARHRHPRIRVDEAREAAKRIGYPVLLKATAGGGGKGMRVVERAGRSRARLRERDRRGRGEFQRRSRLSGEAHPRIRGTSKCKCSATSSATIVHLGERDCSVQKPSHQKLVEEAPAPHLSRRRCATRLHEMAVRACKHVDYTNAGTLEFLVSGDDVYFMEMNTRIQVEHPVTEMVYGIDLVKEQIRIAAGEPLGYTQADLRGRGHAIECRINAEDPRNNFAPQPGRSRASSFPAVRAFASTRTSMPARLVPPYYDSMIAKIVAFGETRDAAIARMERALRETVVEGVNTTIELCLDIIGDAASSAKGATTSARSRRCSQPPREGRFR